MYASVIGIHSVAADVIQYKNWGKGQWTLCQFCANHQICTVDLLGCVYFHVHCSFKYLCKMYHIKVRKGSRGKGKSHSVQIGTFFIPKALSLSLITNTDKHHIIG
jgi:hypothetical protein